MGARLVSARQERRPCLGDPGQRLGSGRAPNLGGIRGGTDDDEVVVHHGSALAALAVGHQLFLGGGGVGEHDVGLTASAHLDRLAATDRDRLDPVAAFTLERRDQHVQQTGVLRARRGRQDHRHRIRPAVVISTARQPQHGEPNHDQLSQSVVLQSDASYDAARGGRVPRHRRATAAAHRGR
jgi:hypothetical protein